MAAVTKDEPGGIPVSVVIPPGHTLPPPIPETPIMADANFAATPYPVYNTGGDDDSVQHAILTSHTGASVERNQDAQFAAGRDRALTADVYGTSKDNAIVSLENRVEVERSARVSDRHRDRQFAELKSELAAMRAEGAAREIASLRADLGETKATARAEKAESLLARLVTKLGA